MTEAQIRQHDRQVLARDYAVRDDFASFCRLMFFEPNSGQEEIIGAWREGISRLVARIGRRGGKTLLAAMMLSFLLLQDDKHAWVVAPTHELCGRVWNFLKAILCSNGPIEETVPNIRGLGFSPITKNDGFPKRLVFSWGSHCVGLTTHGSGTDSLEGESLNAIVWDECARSPDVWETHLGPNLADRGGWALFIGKPLGHNHFEAKWNRGNVNHATYEPRWQSFHFTSEVNFEKQPALKEEFLENRRSWSYENFAQEWLAEFTTFAGQVYKEFRETKDPEGRPSHIERLEYDPNLPLGLAFDFGTTHPFVCLWLQWTPSDELRVIDEWTSAEIVNEEEFVRRERTCQENGIEVRQYHHAQGYGNIDWAVGDPAGKDEIRTLRTHCGFHVGWRQLRMGGQHDREVANGVERVRRLLRQDRLMIDPKCKITIWEFNRYAYPVKKLGSPIMPKDSPQDINNHCMDALRYGVVSWLSRNPGADHRIAEEDEDEEVTDTMLMAPRHAEHLPRRLVSAQTREPVSMPTGVDRLAEKLLRRSRVAGLR